MLLRQIQTKKGWRGKKRSSTEAQQIRKGSGLHNQIMEGDKPYVYAIVAPVIDYWKETIEGKKGVLLARMKEVRIFNPLHVLGNKISVSDIHVLKIFKLYEHPDIRAQIEVIKTSLVFRQMNFCLILF
jgi:hypothetical protein